MILYLGTSSLVKLYIDESCSDLVRDWVGFSEIVATCRVAYTEIISALDMRLGKGDLSKGDYERLTVAFAEDWPHFAVVDFDDMEAARLAHAYGLRRFDAIHLSAVKLLRDFDRQLSLYFSSFDTRLCSAAASEGIRVVNLAHSAVS